MLKRLYVDNYKTLSNFELELEALNFFLGANGSGKSSVFEILAQLRLFVDGTPVSAVFSPDSRTRWDKRTRQLFEAELTASRGDYRYTLELEYSSNGGPCRVARERLEWQGSELVVFEDGEVSLAHTEQPFPADDTRSALSILGHSVRPLPIPEFRELLRHVYVFKPHPGAMDGSSDQECRRPGVDLQRFGSWYRHLLTEKPGTMHTVNQALKEAIPGLRELKFVSLGGNRRELVAQRAAQTNSDSTRVETYRFNELSDGEKLLIGLYTIVLGLRDPDAIVCIDEPLNYISLVELEPLLTEIEEHYAYGESGSPQMVLASHHPILVDFFARRFGLHFKRTDGGPTKLSKFEPSLDSKLSTSEVLREGWEEL